MFIFSNINSGAAFEHIYNLVDLIVSHVLNLNTEI